MPRFRWAETSWAEKRKNIDDGIASLPEPLRSPGLQIVRALQPVEPERSGLDTHPAGTEIETAHCMTRA